MKVIFLKDVPRVGRKYDIKNVPDGYAMNFLLPKKMVELATPKAVKDLEMRKKTIEIEREVQTDFLMKNLEEIKGKTLLMKVKADEKGHLFKGIHSKEIVEEMHAQHHAEIAEEFIVLPKPIKETGEHEIQISIAGKKSSFKLVIEKM
ncbi:MAG TPA: 50S ribosomal protein L9 [Candidatus Paceibacterota bacterium]|jgi:large subunit ribosomal protein L9|nr:50S ribosomal protein L9 [Candidatus Paceibacterota bacterium]